MDHQQRIIWGLVAAIVVTVVVVVAMSKPAVDWDTRYELVDEHPYGASFIHDLLKKQAGKRNFEQLETAFDEVYEEHLLSGKWDSLRSLYVYVGYGRDYDSLESAALKGFAYAGHTVFLAVEYVNETLIGPLLKNSCREKRMFLSREGGDEAFFENAEDADDEWLTEHFGEESNSADHIAEDTSMQLDTSLAADTAGLIDTSWYWQGSMTEHYYSYRVQANFEDVDLCADSGYTFTTYMESDTHSVYWTYFNGECITDSLNAINILGTLDPGKINYIRIPYGEGEFLIHTNPELLTNVELLGNPGLRYAEALFAYAPQDHILWDTYVPPSGRGWDLNNRADSNPLSYILTEPPLRWALYLTVIGSLLFIIFRAKRRQQYIPVLAPNVNTSLEFVEMLGQLYYEQRDHRYMARQMWQQYLDFIRSHYYILAHDRSRKDWMEKLAAKSGMEANRLKGILHAWQQADQEGCTAQQLENLYHKLKYFYANCK